MPRRNSETPTNKLSVYMIKPGINRLEDIIESSQEPRIIPDVGSFYFEESRRKIPAWIRNFFRDALDDSIQIFTASARGTLITSIEASDGTTVRFAVVFGIGRFLLKENVIEERFGLKVALNSADAESIRSIDKTSLGSIPKHSKEQMSRDVPARDFGIDIEQDLIGSVTAKSTDPRFGNIIAGRDALSVSVKVDLTNLMEFLQHCLSRYRSEDYKANFDWIDQIKDVRDSNLEAVLNAELVRRITSGSFEKVWMAVPEVIDWSEIQGFRYRSVSHGDLHPDLDLADFVASFEGQPIDLDRLNNTSVLAISAETETERHRWRALRCIYAEIEHAGSIYVLNNGTWYVIARDFSEEVQRDFDTTPNSSVTLPDYTGGSENDYNQSVVAALPGSCCMDGEMIRHGGSYGQIEFCDIFTLDGKIIHVKRYGNSSVLSHLFAQGVVSAELLVQDEEFRRKLNLQLPSTHRFPDSTARPSPGNHEVIYAVISKSGSSLEIPFFSKVSLRHARRRLQGMGYNVSKVKIGTTEAA